MSKQSDIEAARAVLAAAEAEADTAAPVAAVVVVVEPLAPTPEPETENAADTEWLESPKKLDRSRSFGTVLPREGLRRYQQDGVFFDHFGDLVKE